MYDYEKETRGHIWKRDETGNVDIFAYDYDYHNGPRCIKCGYGFCHHCSKLPQI